MSPIPLGILAASGPFGLTPFIAVGNIFSSGNPHFQAYFWEPGFGTRLANPASFGGSNSYDISWSPDGMIFSQASEGYPFLSAWDFDDAFGTRYSDPASPVGDGARGVAWHPEQSAVGIGHWGTPYISIWAWSGGFGSKFANPAVLPTGRGAGISWHPSGNAVTIGHETSPQITTWSWSGSGFGTKYANPADPVFGTDGNDAKFSPSGNYVAASTGSGQVKVYNWGPGYGAAFGRGRNGSNQINWTAASDAISAAGYDSSTPFWITPFTTSFGAQFTNPGTMPSSNSWGTDFSSDDTAVAYALTAAPRVHAYAFSSSTGFGSKYADPSVAIPNNGESVSFR